MSVDFNNTSSKLENASATHGVVNLQTILCWTFAEGLGEANFGRIVSLDEWGAGLFWGHDNNTDTMRFEALFSGTDGRWLCTATDGQWNAIALSYNGSATGNDPIVRVNYAGVTVTRSVAPVGTYTSPLAGYCVGNGSAAARTWNGQLAHFMLHDVILTAREMDQQLQRPGSVRRGLQIWLPMYHAGFVSDLSGNKFNGTATALTNVVGGPPCSPLFGSDQRVPYASASAGGRISKLVGFGGGLVGAALGRAA